MPAVVKGGSKRYEAAYDTDAEVIGIVIMAKHNVKIEQHIQANRHPTPKKLQYFRLKFTKTC